MEAEADEYLSLCCVFAIKINKTFLENGWLRIECHQVVNKKMKQVLRVIFPASLLPPHILDFYKT